MAHHTLINLNSRRSIFCILLIAFVLLANGSAWVSRADSHSLGIASPGSVLIVGAPETSNSVVYQSEGVAGCRNSTAVESLAIARRNLNRELRSITPPSL